MILKMLSLAAKTALFAAPVLSFAATEVVVQYPYPDLFAHLMRAMKRARKKSCARQSRISCPTSRFKG